MVQTGGGGDPGARLAASPAGPNEMVAPEIR